MIGNANTTRTSGTGRRNLKTPTVKSQNGSANTPSSRATCVVSSKTTNNASGPEATLGPNSSPSSAIGSLSSENGKPAKLSSKPTSIASTQSSSRRMTKLSVSKRSFNSTRRTLRTSAAATGTSNQSPAASLATMKHKSVTCASRIRTCSKKSTASSVAARIWKTS